MERSNPPLKTMASVRSGSNLLDMVPTEFAPPTRDRAGSGLETLQMPWLPSPVPSPPMSRQASQQDEPDELNAGKSGQLVVMKFGGSSLASYEHLERVVEIVRSQLSRKPVVVLSAMGKTTNHLLEAAEMALKQGKVDITHVRDFHEGVIKKMKIPTPQPILDMFEELHRILSGVSLLREISFRARDLIVSFGERLSVQVFEAVFNNAIENQTEGMTAKAFNSWEIGMITTSGGGSADSAYSQAEILPVAYTNIALNLSQYKTKYERVPIVTGYIAHDSEGTITTLGRDGSDLTATVIGAAVLASEIQIWKDVDGIMTTDPRVVPNAKPVRLITFEEAAELSAFGAKVVHPAAVMPAWTAKVPMSVRNSTAPELPGTRIVAELGADSGRGRVIALSSKRNITMIVIRSTRMLGQHGFLAHVFQVFNDFAASVDVIATSEVSISLTLDQSFKNVDMKGLRKRLESVAAVEVSEAMAMLTLITAKRDSVTVLRDAFSAYAEMGISVEMVSHGASNVNVTFVIPDKDLLAATKKVHEIFWER
jgi:aspartate kinase